ncbi:MAG: hypothetical protein KDC53_10740 [Saprospiraceae bacterium]|nr:hypothetical protein [Saprospiraceae bacterium]
MLRFHKFILLIGLLTTAVFISSCDKDDDEPAPTTAKIRGKITLANTDIWAQYQDSGEVQLTIFPEFSLNPPAGWGDVPDGAFGPGVPGGRFAVGAPSNAQNPFVIDYQAGFNVIEYEMEVDPGTYSALALGFRHDLITDPSLKTATLGVYWDNPSQVSYGIVIKVNAGGNIITVFDEPAPTSITVEAGDDITVDFKADFAIIPLWYR